MFFVLVARDRSILLVILQPLAVGTFCTPCLGTAVLMLVMIPFAVDEVVAMGLFLADVRRRGDARREGAADDSRAYAAARRVERTLRPLEPADRQARRSPV